MCPRHYVEITVHSPRIHEQKKHCYHVNIIRMRKKEEEECYDAFVELVNSIYVNDKDFDIYCGYEYFTNNCQTVTTITKDIRLFEFVILVLKTIIKENQYTIISPRYINELVCYIEKTEFQKDWFTIFESCSIFPASKYYLSTIKYELVQFNIHDNMYVLLLKCMNFHEKDVSKAMEVAFYFFSNCFDRPISITPQIKWKFFGNPYISITWILVIQKRTMDTLSGYRRDLLNEIWNDYYSGPGWRPVEAKSNNLLDYMKKLTGLNSSQPTEKSRFRKFIRKSSSFFEMDDTVFAKFSDDKEYCKRWSIFSFLGLVITLLFLFLVWMYLHS